MTKLERFMNEAKDRFNNDDDARFLKSWVKNPLKTGAVMPSSQYLARKMASFVDLSIKGPVIELGPGTGPITEALLDAGVTEERLVLVEYDINFVENLKQRFPKATVIQGDAYNLPLTLKDLLVEKAAAIVSGLPLVTKPENERIALLNDAFAIMQVNAPFIQFTYSPISPIPSNKSAYIIKGSDPVWRNMPPARVFVYKKKLIS
jgi:phosphatidylethanolamine/phosphatidyl-N-methylethanolamine N-methyltransferase